MSEEKGDHAVADTGGGVPGVVTPPSGPSMNIIIMPRVYEYHYCTHVSYYLLR